MEVDAEAPNGTQPNPIDVDMDSPNGQATSSDMPKTNGVNNVSQEDVPPPPAHKSGPSSPEEQGLTPEDAEAFKLSGNKFFKEKNYKKAIEEYTKGMTVYLFNSQ